MPPAAGARTVALVLSQYSRSRGTAAPDIALELRPTYSRCGQRVQVPPGSERYSAVQSHPWRAYPEHTPGGATRYVEYMLTYTTARDTLVEQLRIDARAHAAGRYDEIGRRFDRLEHQFPTGTEPHLGRLHIALAFWDGWIDARNNGWPRGPIALTDWPVLAEEVAADLASNRDISSPLVLRRFDLVAHPKLNERVQTLAARLRQRDTATG